MAIHKLSKFPKIIKFPNPPTPRITFCGSSSVGRASASQAEGRGFEPRLPLRTKKQ